MQGLDMEDLREFIIIFLMLFQMNDFIPKPTMQTSKSPCEVLD